MATDVLLYPSADSWSGQEWTGQTSISQENRTVRRTRHYCLRIWDFCVADLFQIQFCYSLSCYNGRVRTFQRTSWRGIHRLCNEVLFSWRTCHYNDHPHSKYAHFLTHLRPCWRIILRSYLPLPANLLGSLLLRDASTYSTIFFKWHLQ